MKKIAIVLLILLAHCILPGSVRAKTEAEYQQEIQALQDQNRQLENKLAQVSDDLKQAMEQIKQLQDQIAKIMPNAENNAQEVQETRSAMKLVKEQLADCLEQRTAAYEKLCKNVEDQLEQSIKRTQALEKDLKKAEDTITKRDKQIESLKAKKGSDDTQQAQPDLEEVQAELEKLRGQFKATLVLLHEREQELKNANDALQLLQQQPAQPRTANSGADTTIEELKQEILLLQTLLKKQKEQLEAMRNQDVPISEQQVTPGQQDLEKDAEIVRLAGELRKAADYINAQNKQIADLQEQMTVLRNEKADLLSLSTDDSKKLTQQTREVEQLRSEMAVLREQIQKTKEQKEQWDHQAEELDQLKNNLDALQAQLQAVEQQNAQLTAMTRQLEAQLTDMTQQKNAALRNIADLRVELEKREAIPEEAKNRIQELTAELQEVKVQLDTQQRFQAENSKLQQEANDLREQVSRLQAELSKAESLQGQLQTMQTMLQETQEQYAQGLKNLDVKEQLLQKTLTEKALLEKQLQEQGSPEATQQVQPRQIETGQDAAATEAAFQQLAQERALREQIASELTDARKTIQALERRAGSVQRGSVETLFAREILQGTVGAIKIFGWSPDKTKLAYQESMNQVERLWMFNTLTKQKMQITDWRAEVSSGSSVARFVWAFDSEHFLFAAGYPGRYTLLLGNHTGLIGNPIVITDHDVQFAWSPVSLRFAYFTGQMLMIQDIRGETLPVRIGDTPNIVSSSLQWSPDGTKIAFSIKQTTTFDLFLLRLVNNTPLFQSLVASLADDIQPSWSPDGNNIAFYVRSENYDTKIAVTPVDRSRAPYVVAHNVSLPPVGGPGWLSATEILYFGEDYVATSQNSIYTVDISNGRRSSIPMSALLTTF